MIVEAGQDVSAHVQVEGVLGGTEQQVRGLDQLGAQGVEPGGGQVMLGGYHDH